MQAVKLSEFDLVCISLMQSLYSRADVQEEEAAQEANM